MSVNGQLFANLSVCCIDLKANDDVIAWLALHLKWYNILHIFKFCHEQMLGILPENTLTNGYWHESAAAFSWYYINMSDILILVALPLENSQDVKVQCSGDRSANYKERVHDCW